VGSLGRAAWLYLALLSAASDKGVVIRTRKHLAKMLGVAEPTLEVWLSRFANAGLITIKSPSPYLIIVLRFWSGSANMDQVQAGQSESAKEEVPVSNSYSNSNAHLSNANAGVGGQGEGEALTKAIRSLLPDIEAADVERILASYPQQVIRRTIDRVAKTPADRIRKSKTALFRYLLTKLSQELDVREL
jgi:hypothetical protein